MKRRKKVAIGLLSNQLTKSIQLEEIIHHYSWKMKVEKYQWNEEEKYITMKEGVKMAIMTNENAMKYK